MDSVSSAFSCVSMVCSLCVSCVFLLVNQRRKGSCSSSSTAVQLLPLGACGPSRVGRDRHARGFVGVQGWGVDEKADGVLVWMSGTTTGGNSRWQNEGGCSEETRGLYGACAKNAAHCKDRRLMRGVVTAVFQRAAVLWRIRDDSRNRRPCE
jgi:hypothetical protein